ncbi:hypothetical protein Hanom_Chr16g01478781 [Helianthus anomalus]
MVLHAYSRANPFFLPSHMLLHISLSFLSYKTYKHLSRTQWRTQKLFAGGADDVFNHIFKGCGRVFCLKYTLIFFFQGVRPPTLTTMHVRPCTHHT